MAGSSDDLCYVVTTDVAAPARVAFDYLADPGKVGDWALGAYSARPLGGDVYSGTSLYDGSTTVFRVDADARRLLIDYLVGGDANNLVMRISTRVVPGEIVGRGAGSCLVSLSAWRPADFDDRRWSRLKAFHDAEIHILRDRIEAAPAARNKRSS
jgi:hypothetical protein